jgi:hypothetical protein
VSVVGKKKKKKKNGPRKRAEKMGRKKAVSIRPDREPKKKRKKKKIKCPAGPAKVPGGSSQRLAKDWTGQELD